MGSVETLLFGGAFFFGLLALLLFIGIAKGILKFLLFLFLGFLVGVLVDR